MLNGPDDAAYEAPSPLLTAMEAIAVAERAAMVAAKPLLDRLPRGDGHSVLVLPGFMAGDRSTEPLRAQLARLGYRAHRWRLGTNIGPTSDALEGMFERFRSIHARTGRPVSIVGWSLGGIYARELARAFPEEVRLVITLGSPIQMMAGDRSASSRLYESLRHARAPGMRRTERDHQRPMLRVPATSIYTRTDGIVDWRSCLVRKSGISENVEVYGSHCGLGVNASAIFVMADRLAQPAGQWKPFRPPLVLRGAFPRPKDLRVGPPAA